MIVWPESVFTLMLCGTPHVVMAPDWDSVSSPGVGGELLHEAAPPIAIANSAVNHVERVAPPLHPLCHRCLPLAPEHLTARRESRAVRAEASMVKATRRANGTRCPFVGPTEKPPARR